MVGFFKIDKKLTDLIGKEFTVSAEVIPPLNGAPQSEILGQISSLVEAGTQFLSVTKGAGGSLRGGSLPVAQIIKDHFTRPAIAHFTCRDLTPEDIENQLVDHHYFGIRNVLALRGDPPQGQPDWQPNPKSYPYAYQLIEQIAQLNKGDFLKRKDARPESKPQDGLDFCVGAAAYPDEEDFDQQIKFFNKKIDAGADYGITQLLYNVESYKKFISTIKKPIPILPGLRVLAHQEQARAMRDRFQISMPEKIIRTLPTELAWKERKLNPGVVDDVIGSFLCLVEELRRAGAPGIHVFVLANTELSSNAIRALKQRSIA